MSNMIKAYTVRYEEEAKKTIDTHLKLDQELQMKRAKVLQPVPNDGEFVEGLQAVVVEALPSQEEMAEQASQILEGAKQKADAILEQARQEALQIQEEAYAEAQKKGYEDGILQGQRELQKQKAEYDMLAKKLKKEYDDMMEALEPQIVEIMASLIEKITGIMVQDRSEVILHLIDSALKKMEKSDEYTIRVSKEDYEYVAERKSLLLGILEREVPLYITEDAELSKNQCLIETSTRVINCSLDVQLSNLLTDLKLLGGI